MIGPKGIVVNEVFSMNFYLGTPGAEYTRTVYSILDFLGDIGGLFGIFSMFFSFFIGFYNA